MNQELEQLLAEAASGGKRAVQQVFNRLEDRREDHVRQSEIALDRLYRQGLERGHVVGVTGPPGAGKSCLVSAMLGRLRAAGKTVGVIAVDPSSRVSKGALLGDRIRLDYDASDDGVFVRSMANRGELGGVADRAFAGLVLLRAAYDIVIVETVGVGQAETDVADMADTTLFVIQPGSGDILQYMKAGVMETPDALAVNKADLGAPARRALSDVRSALAHGGGAEGEWTPEALAVSAQTGDGVEDLLELLGRHEAWIRAHGGLARSRTDQANQWIYRTFERLYGSRGLDWLRPQSPSPGPGEGPFGSLRECIEMLERGE